MAGEDARRAGEPRIFEPDDYVRAELRAALSRPVLVVPVLVGGVRMPKAEQLPEDIRAITTKNALPLRHESFDDDTENIVAAVLGLQAGERAWEDKGSLGGKIAYAVGGAIAGPAPASCCSLAFLGAGASAFSLDRRASYHADPHRRGADHRRLAGFALQGAEAKTALRCRASALDRREHGLLLVNPLQRERSEIAQLVL